MAPRRVFLLILLLLMLACQAGGRSPWQTPTPTPDFLALEAEVRANEEVQSAYSNITGNTDGEVTRLMLRGMSLSEAGRDREAIGVFEQVIALNASFTDAWFYKGMCALNLNRSEEALTAFDQVLALNPGEYHAWFGKSLVYGKTGNLDAQMDAVDRGLAIQADLERRAPQQRETTNGEGSIPGIPLAPAGIILALVSSLVITGKGER